MQGPRLGPLLRLQLPVPSLALQFASAVGPEYLPTLTLVAIAGVGVRLLFGLHLQPPLFAASAAGLGWLLQQAAPSIDDTLIVS